MSTMTRRHFLGAAAAGAGAVGAGATGLDRYLRATERATRADPAGLGSLGDIDHFVFLMQENRSFDHYFGTMSGVRGFDDRSPAFRQSVPARTGRPASTLIPFRLDANAGDVDGDDDAHAVGDPGHDWAIQHATWNGGRLDRWMIEHVRTDGPRADAVMGYYTRADIPTHYALADAFTVCDHYFSSALGPTTPNRLYWMSATVDPDGRHGGPVPGPLRSTDTHLNWTTFPEVLQGAGIDWKIYNEPADYSSQLNGAVGHFGQYRNPATQLHRRGITPRYPHDFRSDVAAGRLPAVSWIIPTMVRSEHPAHPPAVGADAIIDVLETLTSRPALWERTALIVSYDENGGFFDHVAPLTPPPGTEGEWLRDAGRTQPIGLGFRVPCLVLSPYTRGGLVSSQVFDHTSQLQLLGARFGLPVPNLTAWRRSVTADMTGLFAGRSPTFDVPALADDVEPAARTFAQLVAGDRGPVIDPIAARPLPSQERLPLRRRLPARSART